MYPFGEGYFAVRNGWYVAAFTHEVSHELLGRTILNEPVVIYRKEDGEVTAVGGRCPHRHFPLAKSCLKGDVIVCGYHGIAFGPDGQCVDVPSQAHTPKSYRIPTYPVAEHGAWLFIWMGDPEQADVSLLPDLREIGVEGSGLTLKPMFVEHVKGRYQLLNDNLLDLSHLAFLHGGSIGTIENASVPETLEKKERMLSCRRVMRDITPPAANDVVGVTRDKVDRIAGMDFYLPGFHAGIDEQRHPAGHPQAGKVVNTARVYHAVTPETGGTCHYFFAMAAPDAAVLDLMVDYLKPVIEEDKFATEEIEKMLALIGEEPRELLIKSDQNAVEARRMLKAMMQAERADVPGPELAKA